ncbi:receptor-type tyrosine-protein phosphatase H-like [Pomacea canaliculata]|uniref:receptor-type tyrosine-protein phosphatase H-like n=1 Tax=Pomacea canaliculata TaxID=400727 RepID=UPI000D728D9A|nr:receptor-type tyrosine-protein phosphatase H-like [Pomacea canaliculata]
MILYMLKSTDNTGQDCFDKGKVKCEEYGKNCSKVTYFNGDIEKSQITIAHLLPDTLYTFTVFAVNGAAQNNGAGEAASTNTTTNITVPSNPKDFTATTITKDSINLTWTPPEPRPGPTTYTLVVTDLGSRYYQDSKMDWTNVTHIPGYESKNFTVTGLRPAWNYSFSLSAQTEKGSSENITMTLFTNDSVPGVVQNLNVTPGQVAYKQLTASWRCPDVTDRHTLIRGFFINTTLEGCSEVEVTGCKDKESQISHTTADSQTKSCDIGLCFVNLTDNCDGNETVTIVVKPESCHLIQVQTVGKNFNSTDWGSTTYDSPAGPSGKVKNLNVSYLNESDVSVEWGYPTEPNGLLLGYGLLVYQDQVCERSIWSPQSRKGYFKEKCAEGVYKPKETCNKTETRTSEPLKEDRTEVAISGLKPYTSYNITVFAVNCAKDNNGEGEPDNINFLTNMSASGPVRNLSVVALSDSALQVTWYRPAAVNGELRGYELHVLTNDTKCVQAIKFTNDTTSCKKVEPEADEKLDHCANRTDICRDINSSRQEANITDLLPDTLYTITVFAINDAVQNRGEGQNVSTDGTTNIAAPSKITDFTAVFINNSVTLTWSPPVPRPGPTNYTLVITDLGSRYYQDRTMNSTSKTIDIQGYDITSHIEKDLRSAWNYSFCLSAHTGRGSSQNTSFTISTNDSEPGPVQDLTLTPGQVPYKGVTARWRCPAVTDRNTRITGFAVFVNSVVYIRTADITNEDCESTQSIDLVLTPENRFLIEVFTLGEQFNDTRGVSESYNTSAGPPPVMEVAFHSEQKQQSQKSFQISFCASCLFNESNGKINYFAIIVCEVDSCAQQNDLDSELKVKGLHSWHNASDNNFKDIYRPTNDTWQDHMRNLTGRSRHKRSTDLYEYVVGEDNDCTSKPSSTYCNGPLPPGRSFRVSVASCTAGGCSRSNLSEEVRTLDADEGFPIAAIAGLAAGIVVAVFVVVIVVICKRRLQTKSKGKGKGRKRDLSTRERVDDTELKNLSEKRPILMKDFLDKMTDLRSSPMSDGSTPFSLVMEYEEIKELSPKHPQASAKMDSNKGKNRYTNILPFDHSRVQLKRVAGDECSDYINANFIPGYHSRHEYIATQGPLQHTVDDFWRMVWEQGVPVIVMLSDFIDKGVKKVFPYFPEDDKEDEPQVFGSITVTLKQVQKLSGFSLRTFTLQRGKSKRQVQHFFIENWIDHGANLDLQFLLQFVKTVRTEIPPGSESPMVVHCSAGVGRTGTYIGLDYLTQFIDHTPLSDPIDIFSYVLSMRDCRTTMVQTAEQYVVLYLAAEKLLMVKTGKDNYQEPVYANLAYEEDDNVDEKPEYANVSSPVADDKPVAEQTATEKPLIRHLSTDSSCSTAELITENQEKKNIRPIRQAPKAPPVHEKARRVAQQQSTTTATTTNRFSTDLTSSTDVTHASEPTEDTDVSRTFEQEDSTPTKSQNPMESPEKASLCLGSEISAPVSTENALRKNGSKSSSQKSPRPVAPDRKKEK